MKIITLMDCNGCRIAMWKEGEFPDWLAWYLQSLPNENARALYRLITDGGKYTHIPPGNLAIEIYIILLHKEMV